jgi:hypothetical protein
MTLERKNVTAITLTSQAQTFSGLLNSDEAKGYTFTGLENQKLDFEKCNGRIQFGQFLKLWCYILTRTTPGRKKIKNYLGILRNIRNCRNFPNHLPE